MGNILLVIVTSLTFVGMMLAGSFVYWGLKSRQDAASRELSRRIGSLAESPEDRLFRQQVRDSAADALGNLGAWLDGLVRQAGVNYGVSDLLTRMGIFALAGLLIFVVISRSAFGLLGLMFGAIPLILLSREATARARKLSEQLPDALDLVGRSLQAGHGFSDAMRMCAEEMSPPVAHEFGRVFEEHNLGRDFRECLQHLVQRNPGNFDLKIFVTAVLLQRDTGGNLIEILENIAKTVRERFVFGAKVKALTAEARISALILGLLPFFVSMIILLMRPEYLTPLITDPIGKGILAGAVSLYILGAFLMSQLSTVEL